VSLHTLEDDGYVTRTACPEVPPRVEYALTERARSLLPHINALMEWALENRTVLACPKHKLAALSSALPTISHDFALPGRCNRPPNGREQFVGLLLEPFANQSSIGGRRKFRFVFRVFHHLDACPFGRELLPVFLPLSVHLLFSWERE